MNRVSQIYSIWSYIGKSFLTPQLTMSYNSYILMSYFWVTLYSQQPLNWTSCIFTISINARTFTRLFGIFSFMSFKWSKVIYLICPSLSPDPKFSRYFPCSNCWSSNWPQPLDSTMDWFFLKVHSYSPFCKYFFKRW